MLAAAKSAVAAAALRGATRLWPDLAPPYKLAWLTRKRMLNYYLAQYEHRRARQVLRSYTQRSGSVETEASICFECPQTVMWDDLKRHLADGGAPQAFVPRFTTNETFNYFWNWRKPQRGKAAPS